MQAEHILPSEMLTKKIRVLLIGAGGNGSAILLQLPYLHQALLVWGHPYGLDVTVMDGDTVSETNCVRQPFAVTDIGQNKAETLVSRLNMFWGLQWHVVPAFFTKDSLANSADRSFDIVISCVDSRKARREIEQAVTRNSGNVPVYWLDLGNGSASGQWVLGQPLNRRNRHKAARLRTVTELFPEIVDEAAGEDNLPSCSAAEAIERQEPFVNQTLAATALAFLSRLLRYGKVSHHGAFFNAATGKMSSLAVDPDRWAKLRSQNRKQQKKAVTKKAA